MTSAECLAMAEHAAAAAREGVGLLVSANTRLHQLCNRRSAAIRTLRDVLTELLDGTTSEEIAAMRGRVALEQTKEDV